MQMTREREFWGDALAPWPTDLVARTGIRDADAAYLIDVGLPVGIDWEFEVTRPSPENVLALHRGWVVLAKHDPVPICLVPESGNIVADIGDDVQFVNSNVRTFGAFLMLFREYQSRVEEFDPENPSDEASVQAIIDDIERRMRAADPAAMQDEALWHAAVQEMRNGML
jgi:hypothetical protein